MPLTYPPHRRLQIGYLTLIFSDALMLKTRTSTGVSPYCECPNIPQLDEFALRHLGSGKMNQDRDEICLRAPLPLPQN